MTAALAKEFDALRAEWKTAALDEWIKIHVEVAEAEAAVDGADVQLDPLFNTILHAVMGVYGDKAAPMYQHLMGKLTPSEARAPRLGLQLTLMKGWLPALKAAAEPPIQAQAAPLAALVLLGEKVEAARDQAVAKLEQFTEVGTVKAFIDKVNAQRKATHGKLGELLHMNPTLGLPAGWPETFFLREEKAKTPSVSVFTRNVARLKNQLQRQQALLQAAEADAAARLAAKKQAEQAFLSAEALALEQAQLAAAARLAEIRKRLES